MEKDRAEAERPLAKADNSHGSAEAGLPMTAQADFFDRFRKPGLPGLPKYAQLRAIILAAIENGYWRPGAKLPTEIELTQATPFSLGTVQRAMRALTEDGIVVRRQGHGSFVADSRARMDDPWHCRFWTEDGTGFLPVYPKVLSRRRIAERGPWSRPLGQQGDNIIRIERRISIDDEFAVHSRFFINAEKYGRVMDRPVKELEGANFMWALARELNLPITHVTRNLRMTTFPRKVCRAIEMAEDTVGLFLSFIVHIGRGNALYYQEFYIPPNGRTLHLSDMSEGPGW